jgi:hypothetical protein
LEHGKLYKVFEAKRFLTNGSKVDLPNRVGYLCDMLKGFPLRIPPEARTIAAEALRIRNMLPPRKRAGTDTGLTTARLLASNADHPGTWDEIRKFWPRWASAYTEAKAKGYTAATSKTVQAGDLWGGMPMLEEILKDRARIDDAVRGLRR